MVCSRELLINVPFREDFPGARYEDMEIGYRLEKQFGHQIRFVKDAQAGHVHTADIKDWLSRLKGYAYNAVHFMRVTDSNAGSAVGVATATKLTSFVFDDLKMALRIIKLYEPRVHVPPAATTVYGEQWEWEILSQGYRIIQNFFHLMLIRSVLGLDELIGSDERIGSTEAMDYVISEL